MIKSELRELARRNTNTRGNLTAYTNAEIDRDMDNWFDIFISEVLEASEPQQFDDKNYNFLPIGYFNLEANATEYNVSTVTDSDGTHDVERILGVFFKQNDGTYKRGTPISENHPRFGVITTSDTTSETPIYYDKIGETMRTFPIPSENKESGVMFLYERRQKLISTLEDDDKPGFSALFHQFLPDGAAAEYWMAKDQAKSDRYFNKAQARMLKAVEFYSRRSGEDELSIVPEDKQHH